MMRSLEILCLVLVGFALVQAQVQGSAVGGTEDSSQSTTSVYDRLAERMKKLGDRTDARARGLANKINEASIKVQGKISELNTQSAAAGQGIMQEARIGASNLYDGASGIVSEVGNSLISVITTSAVGAYRLGHVISQVGQPEDSTQELIDLLEDE